MTILHAADLFCGAGGTSSGLKNAADRLGYDLQLLAINHWDIAIATHSANHPDAEHRCESLDSVDPRKVVPGGYLDLLVASPECTHHSRARGGKPISDQSRASAWHILRWAEALYIENILIENVAEFMDWGPLDKNCKPIQSLKGKTFLAFIEGLKSLGYNVDWRVINTADYGDPTTRKRLFVMARREKPVVWPVATFSKNGGVDMLRNTMKWRAAREIIDWSLKGESIFSRKKPLSENTMKRIAAGLKKFSGLPFIVGQQSGNAPRSVNDPLMTITTTSRGIGIAEPFLIQLNGTKPNQINGSTSKSIEDPVPTLTGCNHIGLVEPFLVQYHGSSYEGGERVRSVDQPMPTVATNNQLALVEPFILAVNHGKDKSRTYDIGKPMPTVTGVDAWGLIEPFLVQYYGNGKAQSVDDPLATITARDRFGLVIPTADGEAVIDIRFRMLQPHELARAMSFPDGYQFSGNREQRVKQIGNAVPVRTAQALCESLIGG